MMRTSRLLRSTVICLVAMAPPSRSDESPDAAPWHTLLLLDEACVESADGVTFHLNQATKHPNNPVLLPGDTDQWDSLQISWPGTVLYDQQEQKFRCWYSGLDAVQDAGRFWLAGYAESTDGVHWVKPPLGQVTYLDRDTNRIAAPWNPSAMLRLVFEFPQAADAPARFGCLCTEVADRELEGNPGKYFRTVLGHSADGVQWTRSHVAYEAPRNDRPSYQDICQLLFDPDDERPDLRVKAYSQILRDRAYDGRPNVRQIGLAHGRDLSRLVDAAESVVLAPEEGIDEELHDCSVARIGDTYVMLFESDTFSTRPIHGDIKLAVSRDGCAFRRVHKTTPFVATGPKGSWDANLVMTSSDCFQLVGDVLHVYYFGAPDVYNSWPSEYAVTHQRRGGLFYPVCIGLATIPRDRFAYAAGAGTLVSRPLEISPRGVWVNATGQAVTVSVLSRAGTVMARGWLGSKVLDTVYRRVEWGESPLPAGSHRLQVSPGKDGHVYSIRY